MYRRAVKARRPREQGCKLAKERGGGGTWGRMGSRLHQWVEVWVAIRRAERGGGERQAREFICNRTLLVTVSFQQAQAVSLECLRHWSVVLLDSCLHRIR